MQIHICTLVGKKAKFAGSKKNWQRTQTLYWRGAPIKRDSVEYQTLLDRAYATLAANGNFRKALLASGNSALTHGLGKHNPRETVLTENEFVSRLTKLRAELKKNI